MNLGVDQVWWVTKIPGEDRFVACIVEFKQDIWMIDDFDPDVE